MKHSYVRTLCECAVLLALSVILSLVTIVRLPFDGAVTLCSMLPIFLVCLRHGAKWGFATAFCYSFTQILLGGIFGVALTPVMLLGSLFLDYLLAFSVLGVAGFFRRFGTAGKLLGVTLACALRFLVHFLSGIILWANYAEFVAFGETWVNHPALYSLCYNGMYMLPDAALVIIVTAILLKIPQTRRLLDRNV